MKKLLSIFIVVILFLFMFTSVGLNIYLYSKYNKDIKSYKTTVSDLQSSETEKNESIVDLKDLVKSAEIELKKDLNEDGKIGDVIIEDINEDLEEGDDCNSVSSDGEFVVTRPCTNEKLGSNFTIKGRGRVYEAQFSVRIKDTVGTVLYTGNFMTEGGYKEELDAFEDTWQLGHLLQ